MKYTAKEGQLVFAGRVGLVERKTDSLVSVRLALKKSKEETEWVGVAFCNPKEGVKGQKLAEFAEKYVQKGMYLTVVANAVEGEKYTNYYVSAVELGPSPIKKDPASTPNGTEEEEADLPF